MVMIQTAWGPASVVDDSITRIAGPLPDYPFTRVWGPMNSAIETTMPAAQIASMLSVTPRLAVLTDPMGDPVWIKASAVTILLPPPPPMPPQQHWPNLPQLFKTIVEVGHGYQAVQEDFQTCRAILNSLGGHTLLASIREIADPQEAATHFGGANGPGYSPW